MLNDLLLLAQRGANSPINRWLNEHPLVLGLIFLAIGGVLAGSGVYELRTGVSRDKRGREIKGKMGTSTSILRVVGGIGACIFGLYKMVAGLFLG